VESWRTTRPSGLARKPTSADTNYNSDWTRKSDGRHKIFGYTQKQGAAGNHFTPLPKEMRPWSGNKGTGDLGGHGVMAPAKALKDSFKFGGMDGKGGLDGMKNALNKKQLDTPGKATKREQRAEAARKEQQQTKPRWDLVAEVKAQLQNIATA
jgi:hypothetical protein